MIITIINHNSIVIVMVLSFHRLANKQDRDGALDEATIIDSLLLQQLANENKCLTLFVSLLLDVFYK